MMTVLYGDTDRGDSGDSDGDDGDGRGEMR